MNGPQPLHHQHGHWLTVETCALAVAITLLLAFGHVHVPLFALFLACLTSMLVVVLIAGHRTGDAMLTCACAAWTIILPGWLAWIEHGQNPWTWPGMEGLFVPSILATAILIVADERQQKYGREARRRAAERAEREKYARWERAFETCGVTGIRVTWVRKHRAGQDVGLRLPADGTVTLRSLQSESDRLATALRLQPGALTFEIGKHSGDLIMHVDELDVMADVIRYPDADPWGTSVHDPVDVGYQVNGDPMLITFDEIGGWLITGVTGSGKSNLLNVLVAKLTGRQDTVVCAIDLAGGRLVAPWIRPWLEGRCEWPAIEWVATTRDEAYIMLKAIDDVITGRGESGLGWTKIRPTKNLPAFVIIVDEMADVTADVPRADQHGVSPTVMAELGAKLTRKARKEAVKMIWATQRGTVDFTGSSAIKSQSRGRVALAVSQQSDAQSVTDNVAVARLLAQVRHQGAGVVEMPDLHKALLTKFYRLDADDSGDLARIDEIAVRHGGYRPGPDPLALDILGDRWVKRWDAERCKVAQRILAEYHERTGAATIISDQPEQQRGRVALAEADVHAAFTKILDDEGLGESTDPKGRILGMLAGKPWGLAFGEIWSTLVFEKIAPADKSTAHKWLRDLIGAGMVTKSGETPGARYILVVKDPEGGIDLRKS